MDDVYGASCNLFLVTTGTLSPVLGYLAWSRTMSVDRDGSEQDVAHAYVDAVTLCERDPVSGAAKVEALDQLHGERARPAELGTETSTCLVEAALAGLDATLRLISD